MNENKRSIQDIIPPARSRPLRSPREDAQNDPQKVELPLPPQKSRSMNFFVLGGSILAVVIIVGGIFGFISTALHSADITITPEAFMVTVAQTFSASEEGENLSYEIRTFESTESAVIARTGVTRVEDRASGVITVYNEYSSSPQRLIANTRFETSDGLIFRVRNAVTVPGYTTAGGNRVPGTIEVTVFAEEPGEKYNIPPTSFTLPGLAGSPQFDGIFARSENAITGGFIGERAVVSPEERDRAVESLKVSLDRAVREGLMGRVSEGELIPDEGVTVSFVVQPERVRDEGAEVSVRAIAEGVILSESQLGAVIAEEGGVQFDAPLRVYNKDELSIVLLPREEDTDRVSITVSGPAELVALINSSALISELAGKNQDEMGAVVSRYPGIRDIRVSISPFWRHTLPAEPDRFSVTMDE